MIGEAISGRYKTLEQKKNKKKTKKKTNKLCTLCENCPNAEFFLILYSDQK